MELEQRIEDLAKRIEKVNSCHVKSGPTGGQFCETGGGGRGGTKAPLRSPTTGRVGAGNIDPKLHSALRDAGFRKESDNKGGGVRRVDYTKVIPDKSETPKGFREVTVQLWGDGNHRVVTMLNGRSNGTPTGFTSTTDLPKAIQRESTKPPTNRGKLYGTEMLYSDGRRIRSSNPV